MNAATDNIQIDECLAGRYPRELRLRSGDTLTLTPMVASDFQLLEQFIRTTPDSERLFFRRDSPDPDRVRRWCSQLDYTHILPLLAWRGEHILADGILQRDFGLWTSHVGKVRLLVHPAVRRRGIGTLMMRELAEVAQQLDLHKLVYECAAEQVTLRKFLRQAGFHEAARLPEFIQDREGNLHEMVVLVR